MKKIIPVSILIFIALGVISVIFINPQKAISHEQAFALIEQALDVSEDEDAYFWKETRNWMTVYNKFYSLGLNKSEYPEWFGSDGEPLMPDKFIFRVVNVYGEKENVGDYNFVYENGQIKDYGFYIREEMSFGKRIGSAATIADEKRAVFNKIIGVNTSLSSSKKDNKNYLFNYYIEAAMNSYKPEKAMFNSNYLYTDTNYNDKGGWERYNIPAPVDLLSAAALYDYYQQNYKQVYGLKNLLSELRLLSDLTKTSLYDYVDFDFKNAVCSTNYENGSGKPLVTKIAFKITDKYFDDFAAAFPDAAAPDAAKTKYNSIFAGADYVSIELILGKVSQIVCYVDDVKPTLGFIYSPIEAYTLQVTYLGPKISKPAWNANGKHWYENLTDQW
jgi:hypothetical protein